MPRKVEALAQEVTFLTRFPTLLLTPRPKERPGTSLWAHPCSLRAPPLKIQPQCPALWPLAPPTGVTTASRRCHCGSSPAPRGPLYETPTWAAGRPFEGRGCDGDLAGRWPPGFRQTEGRGATGYSLLRAGDGRPPAFHRDVALRSLNDMGTGRAHLERAQGKTPQGGVRWRSHAE